MKKQGTLITPSMEFQNEFNQLLALIAEFIDKSQEKGFKLSIDARLSDDYKTLKGELYKPIVDVEKIEHFEKKEVSDESIS